MKPEILQTPIKGLILIKPTVFIDERGYFLESYNQEDLNEAGINDKFVQDNMSMSKKGTLRGLHFQKPPYAQSKLISVISGIVLDIVVDIRKSSPTYGKYFSVELSGTNFMQIYVPKGFAHGFITLEDNTVLSYKCSDYYHKESEGGLIWNDPALSIPWGSDQPVLSEKDKNFISIEQFKSPF